MNQTPKKPAENAFRADYTQRSKQFGLFVVLTLLILAFLQNSTFATSITKGFNAEGTYPIGSVLSVSQENPEVVELTNSRNVAYIAGIASRSTDGSVTLKENDSNTFVAINGDSQVLVSTLNGPIVEGDLIGPSPVSGVAQKVDVSSGGRVLGAAIGAFDGTGGRTEKIGEIEIQIGMVPIRILLTEITGTPPQPVSFIEKIGVALAGSQVSTMRVIIATVLFLIAFFISGMMLFGSIKGTFLSIGRNPLASESIFSNLMHLTFVAATILVVGAATAYLVLSL